MKNSNYSYFLSIIFVSSLLFYSCDGNPKVIQSKVDSASSESSTGIFSDANGSMNKPSNGQVSGDMHNVKVLEVLTTSKYVYLNVEENGEKFWIATGKKEVKVGENYIYKGGLLKTNFESKEYDRVFDKVYLVSSIVNANHGQEVKIETHSKEPALRSTVDKEITKDVKVEGSTSIKDIVKNASELEGKEVQVSGRCVKINPNIMGRNWVHLKDGSMDEYDLVVTTDAPIPEGHVVTMTAKVSRNKDFGAGYRYELILEEGKLIR